MAFDWHQYFAPARWLQHNTPAGVLDEASWRSAISRAYYAAFGYARQYAANYLQFQALAASDDHGRLRAHLVKKRRQKTSDCLDRLRQWRNECDYNDTLTMELAPTLAAAIAEVEYVFRSLPPPTKAS